MTIEKLKQVERKIKVLNENLHRKSDLWQLYSNPWQNTVTFQEKVIEKIRKSTWEENNEPGCVLLDHTPIEMVEFFTVAYNLSGFITDYGFFELREKYLEINKPANCAYIYILCPIENSMENMKIRNREGERVITPFILSTINKLILLHHDSNVNNQKLLLYYEKDEWHIDVIQNFIRRCKIKRCLQR